MQSLCIPCSYQGMILILSISIPSEYEHISDLRFQEMVKH
ncbi:unnamed protein product, partial [Heterotrigona itama]